MPYRAESLTRLIAFACAAMLFIGATGSAAEEGVESIQPPAEPPPLSSADVDQRYDEARARLGVAQKAVAEEEFDFDVLNQELDEFEAGIVDLRTSIENELETFNPLVFDRIRQSLAGRRAQADSWNAEFIDYTEKLAELRSALRTDTDFFDNILTSDQAADLPTALAEKIDMIRRDIDTVREELAEKLNDSVSLRARIADYQANIDTGLEQLKSAATGRRGRVVGLGTEPLLKTLRGPWQSPAGAFGGSRDILIDTWKEYDAQHRSELIFVALLLPLLFFLVWSVRTVSLEKADATLRDHAKSIFVQRPLAAALVIWLSFGPELLTTELPWAISDILGVCLILAMLRLLPLVVKPELIGPVGGLLILAFVIIGSSIVYAVGPVHRLIMIGATVIGIVVLLRMIRAATPASGARSPAEILWVWLARVGIVALIFSVIFEFYGTVGIAEQLRFAVLVTNIVFVVVLATELVLRTGWEILLDSGGARHLNAIRRHPVLVQRRGIFVIRLLLAVFVISLLPDLFPIFSLAAESVDKIVTEEWVFGYIRLSLGNVLALLVGLIFALYIPRLIRFILDEDLVPRLPVDPGAGAAATRLTYYVLVVVGVGLAFASAGFEFGQIALIIGALGVGIGFGLQNIVNDFVSGIVVAFERPFQVGDTIEVGQLWGRVKQIGLRASTIRTFEGAEVIVPNASLISGQVINWTLSDRRRRIDIPVGVSYGSDPEQVQEILVQAVADHPACLDDPPPTVLFRDFGESALNFELRFWTPDAEQRLVTLSDVAIRVNASLKAAGITIPFPQRDLHMISGDKKEAAE